VTLGVRVAAEAVGARVRHLRTAEGRQEVDLIVVREDHRIVAIEVKLAGRPTAEPTGSRSFLPVPSARERVQ
jgi:predicted AAA+ superfamily ATPase